MPLLTPKIHTNIQNSLLFIAVATLFFPRFPAVNSTCLILLVLNWLAEGNFQQKWHYFKKNALLQIMVIFFGLHILGLIHTTNLKRGLFELQVKLPLLVLPLVVGTMGVLSKNMLEKLLKTFVFTLTFVSFFCLLVATWRNYQTPTTWQTYFVHHELGKVIGLHPAYFSAMVIFGFYVVLYFLYHYWHTYKPLFKGLFLILLPYFTIFLLLLSIRMQLLTFGFLLFIMVLWASYEHHQLQKGILLSSLLVLILVGLIYFNPITYQRFKDALDFSKKIELDKEKDHTLGKTWDGRALRIAQWQCALSVIEKNWLVGVGTGDCFDELQKSYQAHNFLFASKYNSYDAHNQYLETAMGLGIIGLILFLWIIFAHLNTAWNNKAFLYVVLVISFMATAVTENVLCRNQGVVFFTLILFLLHNYYHHANQQYTAKI
ncbi:MAG: O-antigen ligase family protein [Microscillaceae bacterium]|nr:O-antigen ligase family protein [Microscillaceae bacterium]MDW8460349.1 O-antigen ligase family protein [Cytophagales bacterium]